MDKILKGKRNKSSYDKSLQLLIICTQNYSQGMRISRKLCELWMDVFSIPEMFQNHQEKENEEFDFGLKFLPSIKAAMVKSKIALIVISRQKFYDPKVYENYCKSNIFSKVIFHLINSNNIEEVLPSQTFLNYFNPYFFINEEKPEIITSKTEEEAYKKLLNTTFSICVSRSTENNRKFQNRNKQCIII